MFILLKGEDTFYPLTNYLNLLSVWQDSLPFHVPSDEVPLSLSASNDLPNGAYEVCRGYMRVFCS